MQYEFSFTTPTYDDYTVIRDCLSRAGEPVITVHDDGDGRVYSVRTTVGQANLVEAILAGAAHLHWADKVWYRWSENGEWKTPVAWVQR